MSLQARDKDSVRRFIFENLPVRGEVVHLDASWRAALERVDYPESVRTVLGEAMAAAVLLASMLKFKGSMTLQLQSEGLLKLLVVQCTSEMNVRGLARWEGEVAGLTLSKLTEGGRMAVTIQQQDKGEQYQGIVPLEGDSLAASFEAYFQRSEQLPTRLWLSANEESTAGMLLQMLPDKVSETDAWDHTVTLADTLTDAELVQLSAKEILHRLYHQDDVRLFEANPVVFRCSCSRDRIADMLRNLGRAEIDSILVERDNVKVDCEFCGKEYIFDRVDAEQLFADGIAQPGSSETH
ncbi:MAG: Hsp33 family molecular chaperone HslO [Gammaproteobacteria bacterium]|nr:Hsp33 family molecular chaperone HslO [Gammaproteobacteria bacterium]